MKKNHKLGELIASIQERNGWSDRDLQQRAETLGLTALSKSNFSRWRTAPVNSIKGSNIRDMAKVLGVPEAAVASAALESMGVSMEPAGIPSLDQAISLDVELSTRDKTIVRAVLEVMRQTEELSGSGNAAPITHAGESPATEQERHERTTADSGVAAMDSGMPDENRHVGDDDLARRRRERAAGEVVPLPLDDVPMPDEELMAGYDAPSEGKALREAQDADAEGPQE